MKQRDSRAVKSKDVMSKPVIAIDSDRSLEDASKLMIRENVSKLAVLENGRLKGIITSTDIIKIQPMQVDYLEELVRARFVPRDLRS
jgi:CBS domain-containing protein